MGFSAVQENNLLVEAKFFIENNVFMRYFAVK